MSLVACSLPAAIAFALLLRWWGGALLTDRWRTPGWFIATAGLCTVAAAVTWFVGVFSGSSLDPKESCRAAGATYDDAYRSLQWREHSRWFPLHNWCNADYDLVPVWVNPALVSLALLATVCLGVAGWLFVERLRRQRTS
ncbi:hypothetical protein [Polymorphospora sp. NPDC050346]|uniref:hypothetical protein n=1 Tax=Polymorphospora sp. NPDC050346 TaxID=3155780 RepID=UPI0034086CF6